MAVANISNDYPRVYGFDDVTTAAEVSQLVDSIRKDLGLGRMNKIMIYVLSGTHGDKDGNLRGQKIFFLEDKSKELQTVKCVNVNENTPKNTWNRYFSKVGSILILAWCWSERWKGLEHRFPKFYSKTMEKIRRQRLRKGITKHQTKRVKKISKPELKNHQHA